MPQPVLERHTFPHPSKLGILQGCKLLSVTAGLPHRFVKPASHGGHLLASFLEPEMILLLTFPLRRVQVFGRSGVNRYGGNLHDFGWPIGSEIASGREVE